MYNVETAVRDYLQISAELSAIETTNPHSAAWLLAVRPLKEDAAYRLVDFIQRACEDPMESAERREYARQQLDALPPLP